MAYNLVKPVNIITDGDMSSSITSSVVEIMYQDNIAIQLDWDGTPTGSFEFQISNNHREDILGNVVEEGTWVTLPLDPAITASGSADNALVDLNQLGAAYVRVVYTAVSGSGTLNAVLTAKGV